MGFCGGHVRIILQKIILNLSSSFHRIEFMEDIVGDLFRLFFFCKKLRIGLVNQFKSSSNDIIVAHIGIVNLHASDSIGHGLIKGKFVHNQNLLYFLKYIEIDTVCGQHLSCSFNLAAQVNASSHC